MNVKTYDIVIVGSGIVGLTAALAIAKNTSLSIAVLEAKAITTTWKNEFYDYRVSAISLASKEIFKQLNIWDAILKKRISPYTHMHVWDTHANSEIYFDCKDVTAPALGYIIEDSVMRTSLLEELGRCSSVEIVASCALKSIAVMSAKSLAQIVCEDGTNLETRLLIAADGANSLVREILDIPLKTWDYNHTAIVTTLKTELSHQFTARQRFLETGPLAFLPLDDPNYCSIVWSTSHTHAAELMAMDDDRFCVAVSEAFQAKLGAVKKTEKRFHFPLHMRHAKHYVQAQVALIGDAAHTIHPLAGQGVNLGLLDAVCLAEVLIEAIRKQRDFSALSVLRRYERWRKSDNLAMLAGVELIKQLFASKNVAVQHIKNAGINFTNRNSKIKNFFACYALGERSDLPSMAKYRP